MKTISSGTTRHVIRLTINRVQKEASLLQMNPFTAIEFLKGESSDIDCAHLVLFTNDLGITKKTFLDMVGSLSDS